MNFFKLIQSSKSYFSIFKKIRVNNDKRFLLSNFGLLVGNQSLFKLLTIYELIKDPLLNNIPEKLEFDLVNSEIGDSVKISNIMLPEGVKPTIADRDFVIATLVPPTVEVEETKPEETAEGEESSDQEAKPEDKDKEKTEDKEKKEESAEKKSK